MKALNKNKVLFFGELPPITVHGASISNAINLSMLQERFDITKIQEIYSVKNHSSGYFKKFALFFKVYVQFIKKLFFYNYQLFYGVIYLSTFGILKNLFTVLMFKIFNLNGKVILHFHRSDYLLFYNRKVNKILLYILDSLVKRYILLSENQVSDFTGKDLSKYYILKNTIEEEFDISDLNKHYRSDSRCLNLIYVGNFIREKGIIELIKAVQLLNNRFAISVKLRMYGVFASENLKSEALILLNNDLNISFHDPIYGKDKITEIFNSDLLILPSYNEGLPIVLLESMSVGIPVIITAVGFIPDALGSDYPLYCKPGDIASIVTAVEKYLALENKSELKELLSSRYMIYSQKTHLVNLLKIFSFEN